MTSKACIMTLPWRPVFVQVLSKFKLGWASGFFGEDVVRGEIFLSICYPRWGKVRLGSVQMVELVDLSNEGVVRGEFFLGRSVAYLI